MNCIKCGIELTAGDKFCGKCGAITAERAGRESSVPTSTANLPQRPRVASGGGSFRTVVVLLLVCIAAIGGWFLWQKYGSTPTAQVAGPIVKVPPSIAFMGKNNDSDQQPAQRVARAERLIAMNPRDPHTLNDAGVLIESAGDSKRAGQLLSQAHQLAPTDPVIDYNFARNLYKQGKIDDAIQEAHNTLAQKSDFDEARVLLADAAIQKKDYATAEDSVSKLKQVVKEIIIAAYTIRGVILLEKGKTQEAQAIFQEALKLAGTDPTSLYNMGVAQQRGNNLSDAQNSYERALAQDPNFAEAHNNLGTVLMASGKQQAAFDEFHAAAVSDPGSKLFAGNLSETSKQGSDDKIVGTWELEGGQYSLTGTANGQHIAQTIQVPAGSRISFNKVGSGAYTAQESAMGMQFSTTFRQQPDGSYSAPAVIPDELKRVMPPGVSDTGTVVFWVHGERLFGDTSETVSGPGTMIKGQKTWKAKRVRL